VLIRNAIWEYIGLKTTGIALMMMGTLFLGGCGLVNEASESRIVPQVTQSDFEVALARTEDSAFDDHAYFFTLAKLMEGVSLTCLVNQYFDGRNELQLHTTYEDTDWLYFHSLEIEHEGQTTYLFDDVERSDKFRDREPEVQETYVQELGDMEIDLLLSLTEDSGFRLEGSYGTVARQFDSQTLKNIRDVITIYHGLEQGLKP
jgi:hypothetical protein